MRFEWNCPYLQPRPGWTGIYLVGYFHCPGHEHEKYVDAPKTDGEAGHRRRHRTPRGHTPEQILADFRQQRAEATPSDIHVRVLQLPFIPPRQLARRHCSPETGSRHANM